MRLPTIDPNRRPGVAHATWLAALLLAALVPTARAAAPAALTLRAHRFTPDHLIVPAGQRFRIRVTNRDTTPDEFKSPALRVEKIVVPGQTITVFAGPLTPGLYKFYDDYHPATAHGTVEAR